MKWVTLIGNPQSLDPQIFLRTAVFKAVIS